MLINKITTGFVVQTFDTEKKQYVRQEFKAVGRVNYEGHCGGNLPTNKKMANFNFGPEAKNEPYLPFSMVQPVEPGEHIFNEDTGHCIRCNCDEDDAYVGGQKCFDYVGGQDDDEGN